LQPAGHRGGSDGLPLIERGHGVRSLFVLLGATRKVSPSEDESADTRRFARNSIGRTGPPATTYVAWLNGRDCLAPGFAGCSSSPTTCSGGGRRCGPRNCSSFAAAFTALWRSRFRTMRATPGPSRPNGTPGPCQPPIFAVLRDPWRSCWGHRRRGVGMRDEGLGNSDTDRATAPQQGPCA
jgi:hypothetical protein